MQPSGPGGASFDRIARAYRWLEYFSFGPALERCRGLQLPAMGSPGQVLVLGDGDGRFTARLLVRQGGLHVVAVDGSEAMLTLLEERVRQVGASSRLVALQGEAVSLLEAPPMKAVGGPHDQAANASDSPAATQALCPAEGFAYVCTHFFLDCLATEKVERLVDGVVPRLAPGALWIVSEFATPTWWTRLIVATLYRGFAVLAGLQVQQLPAWREALGRRGFVCIDDRRLLGGLLSSTRWRRLQ